MIHVQKVGDTRPCRIYFCNECATPDNNCECTSYKYDDDMTIPTECNDPDEAPYRPGAECNWCEVKIVDDAR